MAENFNQMLFDEEIETDNTQTQASGSSQQVNSSDSVIFIKPLPRVQNNDDLKVDNFF